MTGQHEIKLKVWKKILIDLTHRLIGGKMYPWAVGVQIYLITFLFSISTFYYFLCFSPSLLL